MAETLLLALLALAIEAMFGYPPGLYRAIGHPVTWFGALIGWLDRRLNRENEPFRARRNAGIVALCVLLTATIFPAWLLGVWLVAKLGSVLALLPLAFLAASLPAQRSLDEHVEAVADGLDAGLAEGRQAVSMIVGRDPASLDEAGVARAAIESLAENFSDGVVAPAFWLGLGGLAGGVAYKAINTADSMIGHRSARHLAFGWAAARLDDLVNLPASRLSALYLIIAAATLPGADWREATRAVLLDAHRHTSPNAGWPEAAMAGALGLKLAGPRTYASGRVEAAHMGNGRAEADAADIREALLLYRRALLVQGIFMVLVAILLLIA